MQEQMVQAGMVQQLPDWLARQANVNPDVIALDTSHGRLSYRELWVRATGMAGALRSLGVNAGDHVAVATASGFSYALAVHGLMQCDAVLIPVNWRLTPAEVAWQLDDADARVLLCDEGMAGYARDIAKGMNSSPLICNVETNDLHGPALAKKHISLPLPQAIVYTSGTTGNPKGTLLTYQNHFWSAMGSAMQLGVLPGDRWLVPMPLFHVGGLSVLMRSLIYGTTAVVHDRFNPETVSDALDGGHVTMASLVPVMLQRLVAGRGHGFHPALRFVLLGGSAASQSLLERCQTLGIPVAQSYGLTETDSQAATLRPEDGLRKLGSSGKPLLPTEIAIVKDGTRCRTGEVGEIAVKGPTVTPGYLNRPDATRDAIRDGWLHTGDIGYLDAEGFLYVLDRRSDLIVSGGENVYPAEIESVLAAHPDVMEAAVIGKPDGTWGNVPVAYVKLAEGAQADTRAITDFCATRLAKYKVPRDVTFVHELPRNASGKLLRRRLREQVMNQ